MPRFTRPSMTPSNKACASPGSALTGSSSVPSSTSRGNIGSGFISVIAVPVVFLATLGAVEQHPGGEVVAEVLETMLDAGGHEQHFAGGEVLAVAGAGEFAAARDHHVDLVARVRHLQVAPGRLVDLDLEAAMPEQRAERQSLRFVRERLQRGVGREPRRIHAGSRVRAAFASPFTPGKPSFSRCAKYASATACDSLRTRRM